MNEYLGAQGVKPRTWPGLRWWICGLLFASTIINYMDRQTLSVLAPYLKLQYHWTNQDYALIVIAFRVAYSIGQTISGRLIDRWGTRNGLSVSVAFYSIVAMFTSLASGLRSFVFFRFLLGLGESANWPAATKVVSEWFPKQERGWAVALFDSGSSVGGAIAPVLVVWLYLHFGSWQPAFFLVGTLGLLWLVAWRWLYYPPEDHAKISAAERTMILSERSSGDLEAKQARDREGTTLSSGFQLLQLPQTWGVIAARALTDPVWYFITDWFAIYLGSRGFNPETTLLAFWIPFVAADLGNFFGGGWSSWLINRGWSVGWARKAVVILGGIGVTALIPATFASNLFVIAGLFAIATFAYASFSTIALVLPSDLFKSDSVASVSGMSGTAAGVLTIVSTFIIGKIADSYSFKPILIAASLIPLIGVLVVLALVRNSKATEKGLVYRI
ncbi:MAG TPA: MFS transporter [Terriglobia bacterium]|nr:MFS transporter [Terriglobia bacterium]